MSDPNQPGHISVTIKQDEPGGKFNDAKSPGSWIVFHGSPAEVRALILETFQLEAEKDAPLFDLVNEATRLFKATGTINSQLGGRVLPSNTQAEGGAQGGAWDRAQQAWSNGDTKDEPEVDPNVVRLTGEIENVADVPALKELYARNKAVFDANADLFETWKARGRELKSA